MSQVYAKLVDGDPNGLSMPRMLCALETILEKCGRAASEFARRKVRATTFQLKPPSQQKFEDDCQLRRMKLLGEQLAEEKEQKYKDKMMLYQQRAAIPPGRTLSRKVNNRVWWERRKVGVKCQVQEREAGVDFYGKIE